MTGAEYLKVCFATQESQSVLSNGNSADDYSELDIDFRQRTPTDFNPKAVVVESVHEITIDGGEYADYFFWTQSLNCSYITPWIVRTPIPTISTLTTTLWDRYDLLSNTQIVKIYGNTSIGLYYMCYQPAGGVLTWVEWEESAAAPTGR
jgi:hypothetical protein